ncbi:hypothetical protein ACWDX6_24175 [Streptomyces sp. NPDC003027]
METDASGWSAGSNTTVARTTTHAYAGAASLRMTATSTGTVSASIVTMVSVTSGSPYTLYAYFANAATAAGRTASVTVRWFSAIQGGNGMALGSETSGQVALPSTGWKTPPPILVTKAPGGAAWASVTVTVHGVAAGTSAVVDLVTFGPPALLEGNLLPYSVQGCEGDATGWQANWNATTDRTSTISFEGWWALQLTATEAGLARCITVDAFAVRAGTEYFGCAQVLAPAGGTEARIQIRWQDSTGALLSTSSQTWTSLTPDWTRCGVVATAPPGATHARVVLEVVATAAGQPWVFDEVLLRVAPTLPDSLIGYAAQSIEVGAQDWTAVSGCTVARSTTVAYEGIASLQVTASGGADAVVSMTRSVPVTPRQAYQIAPLVYRAAGDAPVMVDMLFTWRAADGAVVSSTYYRWSMAEPAGWYAPRGSAVAPPDAVSMTVGVRVVDPEPGSVFYLDHVLVAPGGMGAAAEVIPGGYAARISLQGLTTGGHTYWGLWRMGPDGRLTPVRGSNGDMTKELITGDVAVAEDYESQLGVDVRYYLKLWTMDDGAYESFTSEPVRLPELAETVVVLKDPGVPARQTTAVVASMPDWTRSARQGVNAVRGRARPIVISDVRTSRTGTLTLVTETPEELSEMWWLLETGATLLIQWPSSWAERDVYVQVGEVTEAHIVQHARYTDRTWSVPLIEVDRPVGGTTGSTDRTWDDVREAHTDWLSVMAGARSWLDVYTGVEGG